MAETGREPAERQNRGGFFASRKKKDEQKEEKDDGGSYIRRERSTGSVSRSFYIDGIDESKVSAEFTDGVLKVELPKQTKTEAVRQIEIK